MRELFAELDAVLFDLDGTLVETNIDFSLMKSEMLRLARDTGIDGDLTSLDILAIVDHMNEHVRLRIGKTAAQQVRADALGVLEVIELRHSSNAVEIPAAHELVLALRERGVPVGIVTRNCRAASEDALSRTRIVPDVLLCREDVVHAKPKPDQLFAALSMLSATPDRSVMVGDHTMDMIAGKAAGMRTIGLLAPDRANDFFDDVAPDAVANNLFEILCAVIDSNS